MQSHVALLEDLCEDVAKTNIFVEFACRLRLSATFWGVFEMSLLTNIMAWNSHKRCVAHLWSLIRSITLHRGRAGIQCERSIYSEYINIYAYLIYSRTSLLFVFSPNENDIRNQRTKLIEEQLGSDLFVKLDPPNNMAVGSSRGGPIWLFFLKWYGSQWFLN